MSKTIAIQVAIAAGTMLLGVLCEARRNSIIQKRNNAFLKEMKDSTEELHKEIRAKLYDIK